MASVIKDGTAELVDLLELELVEEARLVTLVSVFANDCGLLISGCMPMELRPRSSELWLSLTRLSSCACVIFFDSMPFFLQTDCELVESGLANLQMMNVMDLGNCCPRWILPSRRLGMGSYPLLMVGHWIPLE